MKKSGLISTMIIITLLILGAGGCDNNNDDTKDMLLLGILSGPDPLLYENFSSFDIDDVPTADWAFVDGTANLNGIKGTEKAISMNTGNCCSVYSGTGSGSWTDYTLRFKMKTDSAINIYGFYIRIQTGAEPAASYYYLVLDGTTDNFTLTKNTPAGAGSSTLTSGPVFDMPAGTYINFRIAVQGNNIKAYINNNAVPFLDYTDTVDPLLDGSIGFGCSSSNTYVDNILVTPL